MSIKCKTILRSNRKYHKDREFDESLPLIEGEKVIYDTWGDNIMTTVSGMISKVVTYINTKTDSDKLSHCSPQDDFVELVKIVEVSVDKNCLKNEKEETAVRREDKNNNITLD